MLCFVELLGEELVEFVPFVIDGASGFDDEGEEVDFLDGCMRVVVLVLLFSDDLEGGSAVTGSGFDAGWSSWANGGVVAPNDLTVENSYLVGVDDRAGHDSAASIAALRTASDRN